jgi:hypothetical protein
VTKELESPANRDGSARLFGLVISKSLFEAPQLTGEKKPALGSGDEAPAVPLVPADFYKLLFGNHAALGRRKKHVHSRSLGEAQS